MFNRTEKKSSRFTLIHKLTLIVVLPLVCEFIFVAVLFSLLRLSDIDLARVERAKQTQYTCGQIMYHIYELAMGSLETSFKHNDQSIQAFKDAEIQLPKLTEELRAGCSNDEAALHSAEMILVLSTRLLDLLDTKVMVQPSPTSYIAQSTQLGYITQRIVEEMATIIKLQGQITSHLNSRADWHNVILLALLGGLFVSVAISLLVMFYVHADLLRRIAIVTDNTTRIAKGSPVNEPVLGTDEIAQLDRFIHGMNEALRQAETQRREVMSMLAHDMRAPLTSLAVLLDGMATGKYDADATARHEKAKKFLPELERVNRLIDDLLTYEKLNAGKLRLIKDEFLVSQLFEEVTETLAIDSELKHVHISRNCPGTRSILADKYQLKRVLINLCENAIKYSPPDSTVAMKAEFNGSRAVIEVQDEGPGLPEPIGQLFEKYEQAVNESSHKGFGLGLAICKAIIELHGGKIEARNRSDRSGAVISFSLPTSSEYS